MDASAFDRWLSVRFADGKPGPLLALLVIQETLGPDDGIIECSIERHRGTIDGPYVGDPARAEFSCPGLAVRVFSLDVAGRLQGSPSVLATPSIITPDPINLPLTGEETALRAWFGPDCAICARRAPTSAEAMIGLSSIYQVRAEATERTCAVGWFGPIPFVLVADFPRLEHDAQAPMIDEKAVAEFIRAHALVRGELRPNGTAWCLIARSADGRDLFAIRQTAGGMRAEPYTPEWRDLGNDDQRRWIAFAITHEGRTPIDAYLDTESMDLVVLTTGEDNQFWRHRIDPDGIETTSEPANDSAIAIAHAVQHGQRDVPPTAHSSMPAERQSKPDAFPLDADTLLAQTRATTEAGLILRRTMAPGLDWDQARHQLVRLSQVLDSIKAVGTATSLRRRLRAWDVRPPGEVERIAGMRVLRHGLTEELASLRVIVLALGRTDQADVEIIADAFPEARFHLEEAEQCLVLRRPTAAMFHAMHLLLAGLRALPIAVSPHGATTWQNLMGSVKSRPDLPIPVSAGLDEVRRRWHSRALTPAEKYTTEETEAALDAVHRFLRAIASSNGNGGLTGDLPPA